MEIVRGQKAKLGDLGVPSRFEVEVRITLPAGRVVDISCFGLDAQRKLSDDRYLIFYNQICSPCRGVEATASSPGSQRFSLDLDRLPPTIENLVFTATIDGGGTMSELVTGSFEVHTPEKTLVRYALGAGDFSTEVAIMVAEIYRKDVWRLAATGQGFGGGLGTLLAHFGGQEAKPESAPPPPAAPDTPPAPRTGGRISLEKRVEGAPKPIVDLAKKLKVNLEKKKLTDVVAKVVMVLDASGSMTGQYMDGKVQRLLERLLVVALHFDDDGSLELWAYASEFKRCPPVSLANHKGYVEGLQKKEGGWLKRTFSGIIQGLGFGNNEPPVMKDVLFNFTGEKLPVLVLFVTDGGIYADREIEQVVRDAAPQPIFWQFIGMGGSGYGVLERLDNLSGRVIDNANFFAVDDLDRISDDELYDRMLDEFPLWLAAARKQGIVKS